MNGQNNEKQPMRPSFGGSEGAGSLKPNNAPMSELSGQEANQAPAPLQGTNQPTPSEWSPKNVPEPGPIGGPSPAAQAPIEPAVSPAPIEPPQPMSQPAPAPVEPAQPAPAPSPVFPPPSVGVSGGAVPPPPQESGYQIKTMKSDQEALKASGGTETAPQSFTPAPIGSEKVFNTADASAVSAKKPGSKKALVISLVVFAILGIGAVGFFLVKPLLFSPVESPESFPPAIIPEEEVAPPVGEEPPVTGENGETAEEAIVHASFFAESADLVEPLTVESITAESISALFPSSEEAEIEEGDIRELVISDNAGPISFSEFLPALLPDMNAEGLKAAFEDDFTLFVYRDDMSDLPGFIAKVSTDTESEILSSVSSAIESSPNLGNMYSSDPGEISSFKDGSVAENPVRYAPFAGAGYAFNYGWFVDDAGTNYLVASASYEGMAVAVEKAGF
ncbi:MAG: hypothetical protein PHS16_01790 [Candidatus Colwellbacteria bacterium]|jgi:hypothetical protein|nr:hypothetical protein [Candidatus Colwellbacteria bacterium]MDD3752651.1 hypothetical protein [Candidatus Colwellbacteria bacterium]